MHNKVEAARHLEDRDKASLTEGSKAKLSLQPCPICRQMMFVVGTNDKGKKIGSCGCTWKFKRTRSQKDMSRKYIQTPWGMELVPAEKKDE